MVWQSLYIFAELNIRVQQNPPRKKEKKTTLANHQVEMYKCKGILTSRQKLVFFIVASFSQHWTLEFRLRYCYKCSWHARSRAFPYTEQGRPLFSQL